jgi:hypothetical protein
MTLYGQYNPQPSFKKSGKCLSSILIQISHGPNQKNEQSMCCIDMTRTYLKNKISVQGKARNGEKAEHTRSM